ncbi:type II toxin-antitoxin system VapC family toxin [Phenylobacterium sp. LjRoot219]|uniref:type II toxin-antitoxin system VapC family toxin n=1 Tax=Phenylobacterium sp. LjRoot219 TaxID=3342283 RepID=UPI003ECC5AC9
MKLLLDTQLVLWAARGDPLPAEAEKLIENADNELMFSAAVIWEVAIKSGRGRPNFTADPRTLRRSLIDNDYVELAITALHGAAVLQLPVFEDHKDPFDRIMIAQAASEGVTLVSTDHKFRLYEGAAPLKIV